jgi:penicillin-binding protein 1C
LRKVFQVRDALALEREWTKPEILEAYLNLVPMRGDLAGMPAGSYGLLGKGPGDVDGAEAAVLAALIRQPSARPATLATRACKALRERNPNDDCLSVQMISDALPRSPLHLPGEGDAPHLGRQLLTRAGSSVRCTLDRDLQRFVTDALRNRLAELEGRNVADGAAIVIDNSSGEILAYVGSGEEYSSATEVDGVRALRQPGSTLKPFLYAVAIDHGWLNASSIIQDAPFTLATPVGLYAPQDYEHDYKGPVSLRTALASSLNTPAVRTLDLVGVDRFLQTLRSLGLSSLRKDARDYGVGLALGDGEASLLELTNAYRALANGGRWTPATVRVDGEVDVTANSSPTTVFSPGAAFIIGDILADSGARAPTFGLASALNAGMWAAVKTGTSKGMRDNWAIGFTDRYTVGVWVGNFSGASMWDVSGVTGAAPLWHDVVEWLHASKPSRSPAPPAAVHTERVRFQPAIEPSRTEWVLSSTDVCASCESQVRTVEMQPVAAQPRLVLPADGSVVAPDPDIPEARQRIRIEAQGPAYAHVEIDGHAVARSGVFEVSVPLPPPGRHEVNLIGSRGEVLASSTIAIRSLVVHKGS